MNRATVLVISDGEVITSLELEKTGKEWKTAGLGSMIPARAYEEVRKEAQLGDDAILVRVPALNQYFVAKGSRANLELATIGSSSADLPQWEFVPASEALKALQPIARRYNGLPW